MAEIGVREEEFLWGAGGGGRHEYFSLRHSVLEFPQLRIWVRMSDTKVEEG